jgi:hypothetical protein
MDGVAELTTNRPFRVESSASAHPARVPSAPFPPHMEIPTDVVAHCEVLGQ